MKSIATVGFKSWRQGNWLLIVQLCLFVSCSTSVVAQMPPRKIALLVGVSDYFDKGFNDLQYADNDVRAVGHELQRLGFETTVILGRNATREAVNDAIAKLLDTAATLESDGIVFLMFSGHGQELRTTRTKSRNGEKTVEQSPFFCPRDARPFDPSRHELRDKSEAQIAKELKLVSLNKVISGLDQHSNSTRNLLVVDACRNDPGKGKSAGITGSTARNIPEGISILFAAKSGQKSWESNDAKIRHGVMTHFLLNGLRGEAMNRRSQLIWSRVVAYVQEEVAFDAGTLAGGANRIQNPHAIFNGDQVIVLNESLKALPTDIQWNRFRGPNGTGMNTQAVIPTRWSENQNVRWKAKLPGRGASSPVVFDDRVVVTAYSGYADLPPTEKEYGSIEDITRHVLCFHLLTGNLIWQYSVEAEGSEVKAFQYSAIHGYASSTPTITERAVYAWLGSSGVVALDRNGSEIWRKTLPRDVDGKSKSRWGHASSIAYRDGRLIINADSDQGRVFCLNESDGKIEWHITDDVKKGKSFSTPVFLNHPDGDQVILLLHDRISARSLRDGAELWQQEVTTSGWFPQSLVVNENKVHALLPKDILAANSEGELVYRKAESKIAMMDVASPIVIGDRILQIDGSMILSQYNAHNGTHLIQRRLRSNSKSRQLAIAASPVVAGRYLLILNSDGWCSVLDSKEKLRQVASNQIVEETPNFLATPAVLDDCLLIRSDEYLYCIGE